MSHSLHMTWLIHTCNMTHPCVWHDSHCCTYLITTNNTYKWVMSYVVSRLSDFFICVISVLDVCDMTHLCGMTLSYVWPGYVYFRTMNRSDATVGEKTSSSYTWVMSHTLRHDSSFGTCLISCHTLCDISHYRCCSWLWGMYSNVCHVTL